MDIPMNEGRGDSDDYEDNSLLRNHQIEPWRLRVRYNKPYAMIDIQIRSSDLNKVVYPPVMLCFKGYTRCSTCTVDTKASTSFSGPLFDDESTEDDTLLDRTVKVLQTPFLYMTKVWQSVFRTSSKEVHSKDDFLISPYECEYCGELAKMESVEDLVEFDYLPIRFACHGILSSVGVFFSQRKTIFEETLQYDLSRCSFEDSHSSNADGKCFISRRMQKMGPEWDLRITAKRGDIPNEKNLAYKIEVDKCDKDQCEPILSLFVAERENIRQLSCYVLDTGTTDTIYVGEGVINIKLEVIVFEVVNLLNPNSSLIT